MLATLIIVFREVFEAGLVIGIVAAALGRTPGALRTIWLGVGAGVLGSIILAIFAGQVANWFGGFGNEWLNAAVLALAVLMLAWHSWWMAREGRAIATELKTLGQQAARGSKPMMAIAVVVATTVLREGSEVVLFLYGAAAASHETAAQALTGGALGVALGAAVSFVTYRGIIAIPMRWVFGVTTALIALLASGMAAQAARFLQAAGAVNVLSQEAWDWSSFLPEESIPGTMLKGMMGYSDRPTVLMLLAFVVTLAAFIFIWRGTKPAPRPAVV